MSQHCLNFIKWDDSSCSIVTERPSSPTVLQRGRDVWRRRLQQSSPTSFPYLFLHSCRLRLKDFLSQSWWLAYFVLVMFGWVFSHCSLYLCLLWTYLIAVEQVSRRWLEQLKSQEKNPSRFVAEEGREKVACLNSYCQLIQWVRLIVNREV